MRKSMKCVVRIAALGAVIAALAILLGQPAPAHTPYASALSSLVATPAFAAGCPDKVCADLTVCSPATGYRCIHFNGKACRSSLC